MAPAESHCSKLTSPSYTNFIFSICLLLGILLSYLPQHYRIIARRSSQGISPYFVLLGTTSGTCAFANILVLPTSRADLACCKEITGFQCFSASLGIAQVGVQWSCFTVILLLFLLFFPRATPLMPPKSPNPSEPSSTPLSRRRTPSYALAITITAICLLHILLIFLLSLYMVILHPSATQNYANILGIVATILSSIQYLPQLYTTFTLGSVESLSIPMMCIQTPGSFIWAASLAARLGKEGWSAWGVYVVTGTLQGGLLVMGISFELRDRRRRIMEENEGGGDRMGANGGVGNDGAGVETDDEGGHLVEGDGDDDRSQSERTPLLKRGR